MLDTITSALQQAATTPLGLLLAFVLGILSAATSACCTLPILGVLIGYSGTQEIASKGLVLRKALFFTIGTSASLMVMGGVAGFVGHVANESLGRYWIVFAGVIMIFFGLATMELLPFKLSFRKLNRIKQCLGTSGTILAGLVLGGLVSVTALCCHPAIFVVMGVAVLQKQVIQAALLLLMFSIGFSLPLGAVLFGVSLSKALFMPKRAERIVRWIAGGLMIAAGFYFLLTF